MPVIYRKANGAKPVVFEKCVCFRYIYRKNKITKGLFRAEWVLGDYFLTQCSAVDICSPPPKNNQ